MTARNSSNSKPARPATSAAKRDSNGVLTVAG